MGDTKYSRRYPWEEWFRRRRTVLRRGEDYNGRPDSIAQAIYRTAKKRGVTVHLAIGEDDTVTINVEKEGKT